MSTFTLSPPVKADSPSVTEPRTLRICHVSMCLATGGLERLLVEFSRRCSRPDFEQTFVALTSVGQPAEDIREAGCEVFSLNNGEVRRLQQFKKLASILRDKQIDIVHTHNTYAHFYGALAARRAGINHVVNTQHGRGCGDSWKTRVQFRIANKFSDRIIGVSENSADLCRRDDHASSNKIEAIWNGIDVSRFQFRGPKLAPNAISVARLSPEKDFATLLRAVPQVLRWIPAFKLTIVGNGSEFDSMAALINELGIGDSVQLMGERNDIPELLANAGFFVSSSKTEGISLTLLEAMAVGLPIVATSVGGNPEIVVEGKTGRLVPSQDSEAIANAIIAMCQEQDTWPAMSELARQRVEQNFEINKMISQYEALYREITNH